MHHRIVRISPEREHLHGATLAQQHLAEALPSLLTSGADPVVFQLDLSNTISITASYIRATLHWAFTCGQAYVHGNNVSGAIEPFAIRPLPLHPIVTGGSAEVVGDVDDFFRSRELPLLHSTEPSDGGELRTGRLLGSLDAILATTLQRLSKAREATAAQLAEESNENITVNGWSNRLADLYLLRLVTRRRSGKFWIYSPLTQSITLWA